MRHWEVIESDSRIMLRDVTYAGQRGKTCDEVCVTGDGAQDWFAHEPTWRDDADRLDGIAAAQRRGLRVVETAAKAIRCGAVVIIDGPEVQAEIAPTGAVWWHPDWPADVYMPATYRHDETCRRLARWASAMGTNVLAAMGWETFWALIVEVCRREPIHVRQCEPMSDDARAGNDALLDALCGHADSVPF